MLAIESSREKRTTPPPPPGATAAELDQRAAELLRIASKILAQANDLDRVSKALRGGF